MSKMFSYVERFVNLSLKIHLGLALLIRFGLIYYGSIQDKVAEVPYTDIDYKVFTDASRHVLSGRTPYDRHTYRYTPLIAYLLIPNIIIHECWGKVVFSFVDLIVGILIKKITVKSLSEFNSVLCKKDVKLASLPNYRFKDLNFTSNCAMLLWLYSPLSIIISTRGNCDAIASCVVLLTLYVLQCKQNFFLAGLIHGLAIHIRLYPIMYSLCFFMFGSRYSQYKISKESNELVLTDTNNVIVKNVIDQKSFVEETVKTGENTVQRTSTNSTTVKEACQSQLQQFTPKERKTIFKKEYLLYLLPNKQQFSLVIGTALSLFSLTSLFYYLYGYKFLYESYIYHFIRSDTRHNFSVFFYIQYLTAGIKNIGLWQKALTVLPQIVLILVLSVRYGLNKFTLNFAVLSLSIVMVSYNTVMTSQYFIWIFAILPLVVWQIQLPFSTSLKLAFFWVIAQCAWLLPAYLLEFKGKNTFIFIWLQGLSFFSVNLYILGHFIRSFMNSEFWSNLCYTKN